MRKAASPTDDMIKALSTNAPKIALARNLHDIASFLAPRDHPRASLRWKIVRPDESCLCGLPGVIAAGSALAS
jgi:hypothetical protein